MSVGVAIMLLPPTRLRSCLTQFFTGRFWHNPAYRSAAVHISLDEFLARPNREDHQREELIEGQLIVSPGAKVGHAGMVGRLRDQRAVLKDYVLANDFSCILGARSMPVPDLAAIKRDRWARAESAGGWLAQGCHRHGCKR
jgi:hypothetical protein